MKMNFAFVSSRRAIVWLFCLLATGALQAQSTGVLREIYDNIGGGVSVADLTNNPAFPNSPTSQDVIASFETADRGDSYGERLRAIVTAPATGAYRFWIASDDASTLYLSSDATPNQRVPICNVNSWTAAREWTKEPNQQSGLITLNAGVRYYIEALMKEGAGGDHVEVRWQLPNATFEDPIPGARLEPFGLGPPVITTQPANVTVAEGGAAAFSVQVANAIGVTYQWLRGGVNIPGATANTYVLSPVTLGDGGSTFRCFVSNSFGSTNSTTATLFVNADSTRPTLSSVVSLRNNQIVSV